MKRTPARVRIDRLLVDKGLVESREKAARHILAGDVFVDGERVDKAGALVASAAEVELKGKAPFVSRGGEKLIHAIDHFQIKVPGRVCLDVGASTGGFTDCLLQRGARGVIAVDVGHGQLDAKLRGDPRVRVLERTNARHLEASQLGGPVELATLDLSFISLRLVLPRLREIAPGADVLALVKPNFEVGRERVGKGGVVRDDTVRAEAVSRVQACMEQLGLVPVGALDSPVHGPAGNREILLVARQP